MQVFQIRMKVYMLSDIAVDQIQTEIAKLFDQGFAKKDIMLEFHEKNEFKFYCFDQPYPLEKDGIYKKDKIYTVTIRTVKKELAEYFNTVCVNEFTSNIKALTTEIRILPKKMIDTLYTLTPVILKNDSGYWRDDFTIFDFEKRLKANLVKKWNQYHGCKMEEDFDLYTSLEFLNGKPIAFKYKNIKLLGDKIKLHISDQKQAQDLAYFALGTGLCEMNSRGAGFVNYRWL